jgi:hypothetical protein
MLHVPKPNGENNVPPDLLGESAHGHPNDESSDGHSDPVRHIDISV